MELDYDVIIVGSGPAGMSAALYLKRAKINVLLLEKGTPGGKLLFTKRVENYPGFEANSGTSLAETMHQQVREANVQRHHENVEDIIREKDGTFFIKTNKSSYSCSFVIFAAGSNVKSLGIEGEEKFKGRGISFCAICDANFYEGDDVIVIGGGNSGFEEALYLSKICRSVTIISRSVNFSARSELVERAKNTPNMRLLLNKRIEEFLGTNYLEGVKITDKETLKTENIKGHGAFIYVGFDPTSTMLEKYGILDEKGYIFVDETCETKIPRLYAAGDCIHKNTRQAITAVADGVKAAEAIIRKM